jgi:hypothetical protein
MSTMSLETSILHPYPNKIRNPIRDLFFFWASIRFTAIGSSALSYVSDYSLISWGHSFVDGVNMSTLSCSQITAPTLIHWTERVLVASSYRIFFHLSSHRMRLSSLIPLGFHHCRHWRRQNTASQSSSRWGFLLVGLREELRSSSPSTRFDWRGTATAQRRRPICTCFWILCL